MLGKALWLRVSAGLIGLLALAARGEAVVVGDVLPDVSVPAYQGAVPTVLTNAGLSGKVTVINFWATWCAACKVELLEMEDQLKPLLSEKDFQLAFVSLDKDPAKAAEWFQANLKEPDLFLKHLFLDSKFATADSLKVDSFPMTMVIGKDGKIAHVQRGYHEGEKSTAEIAAVAEKLIRN